MQSQPLEEMTRFTGDKLSPVRFELTTFGSGGQRAIQLRHGDLILLNIHYAKTAHKSRILRPKGSLGQGTIFTHRFIKDTV